MKKLRIGLVGLGFIGKVHWDTFIKVPETEVVAVADVEERRREGYFQLPDGSEEQADFSGVRAYADAMAMYQDPDIDVVDLNLPTFMHKEHTLAALAAGKHVICEKPMAVNAEEGAAMITAAEAAKRHLYIAHCIRFWPPYVKAKEIIDSGKYGKVLTAKFNRVSALPTWSWKGWLQKGAQSGLAALDFHIHDADYVQFVFGKARTVQSFAGGLEPGRLDHIITNYEFENVGMVATEGGWEYAPDYSFGMNFVIAMERATLAMNDALELHLYPIEGGKEALEVPEEDGYFHEMQHFAHCILEDKPSTIAPPQSAVDTLHLIEAEVQSAQSRGERVAVQYG